jgi:protein transport protein SEC23
MQQGQGQQPYQGQPQQGQYQGQPQQQQQQYPPQQQQQQGQPQYQQGQPQQQQQYPPQQQQQGQQQYPQQQQGQQQQQYAPQQGQQQQQQYPPQQQQQQQQYPQVVAQPVDGSMQQQQQQPGAQQQGGYAQDDLDFHAIEERNGTRFTWNVWPSSRLEATRCVFPFASLYTPLKQIENLPVVPYQPIACNNCRAVLNPFCAVDYQTKVWSCSFCSGRNQLPGHYASISETNRPAELIPEYATLEYTLPRPAAPAPVFLFVVDTALPEEELAALRDQLIMTVGLLPRESLVGLVTYGTMCAVHELGFQDASKAFVFRGGKDYTLPQVQSLLGLQKRTGGPPGAAAGNRFLLPVSECEFALTTILEDLQRDPWPVKGEHRPLRCAGTAMALATGLMETLCAGMPGRIMLFIGGPVTTGPGTIVSPELKEQLHSWHDVSKGNAPHTARATKFYESIAKRCVASTHVIDVLCACLDQVGLYEMRSMPDRTGGTMLMCEDFTGSIFKQSFSRMFARDESGHLKMGFAATMEVQTCREAKVCGALGPVTSLQKKGPSVGESEIGEAGTVAWKLCGLDHNTTVALYFEVTNSASNALGHGQRRYVQFTTIYTHPSGQTRQRVTTVAHRWVDGADPAEIAAGFDEECAAAAVARLAIAKSEAAGEGNQSDVLRWIDRSLIRLCARFGNYRKDDAASFTLPPGMSYTPQFLFNLRRSTLVSVFNASPDETSYYRLCFNRADVINALIMIQPTLLAYSFDGPPAPVLLDVSAITPDRILLLDSFFQVLVFHGETVAAWRREKYHEQEGHENFAQLLEAPRLDAEEICAGRMPVPRLIMCDQNGSQARYLLAKLNPSATHNSNTGSGAMLLSDDVSLQVFTEHLKRLAVQGST